MHIRPGKFIEEHALILLLQAFLMILLDGYLLAMGIILAAVIYIDIFWLLTLITIYFFKYRALKRRCRCLWEIYDALDEKYLFSEIAGKTISQLEEIYFELNRGAGKAMLDAIEDARTQNMEYKEYIESWIHEVKTPITAVDLICKNHPGEATLSVLAELSKINGLVEQALYYARSGSVEKDYFVTGFPVGEAVIPAVQTYRTLILSERITLEIDDLEEIVYSDKKWVTFILQQLLSNAVKYVSAEKGCIRIYARAEHSSTWLFVEDNGCGIRAADLPRIYEKGFTGSCRSQKKATGMGLYLAKKLCQKLGLALNITSQPGDGTVAAIGFPAGNVHQNF